MQILQIASRNIPHFPIWMAFLLVFLFSFKIFLLSVLSSQFMNGWQSTIQPLGLLLKIQIFFQGDNVMFRVSVLSLGLKKTPLTQRVLL